MNSTSARAAAMNALSTTVTGPCRNGTCAIRPRLNDPNRRNGNQPSARNNNAERGPNDVNNRGPASLRNRTSRASENAAAATRSRLAKVGAFVELLRRLEPDEVVPVVAWLSGGTTQGRIGVGWATIAALDADPALEPGLSIGEVDGAFAELAVTTGPGSVAARNALLRSVFSRATPAEVGLLREAAPAR